MAGNDGVNVQSRRSDIKLRKTEHFVSHIMVLDKAFWDLKVSTTVGDTFTYLSNIAKNGDLVSEKFSADDDGDVFWRIRLTLNPNSETEVFRIHLDAEFNRTDIHVLGYAYSEHDVNSPFNKKPLICDYDCVLLAPKKCAISDCGFGLDSGFEEFRVDVSYAIVDSIGQVDSESWIPPQIMNNQVKSLISGIAALLENPIASDVTLRCNGVEWKLHKNILATSSKVFAAMFSCEMKENTEDAFDIDDVDNKVLDLMIKFIYNAEIDETEIKNAAEELLISADRYDLSALMDKCEEILIPQLCVENCLRLFLLGHNYNSLPLRTAAKRFVALNLPELCKAAEYKTFLEDNSDLSIEIYLSSIKI